MAWSVISFDEIKALIIEIIFECISSAHRFLPSIILWWNLSRLVETILEKKEIDWELVSNVLNV